MNAFVLDANVALRAVLPAEPAHVDASAALSDLLASGLEAVAPDLFPYEIGNVIRRTGGPAKDRVSTMLEVLQVARLQRPSLDALAHSQAAESKLSFYDATYVALAEELGTLLWTEDRAILKSVPEIATDTANIRRRLRA